MSGPTTVVIGNPLGDFYSSYRRYGQSKPYVAPLPYMTQSWTVVLNSSYSRMSAADYQTRLMDGYSRACSPAVNKATTQFNSNLRAVADMATTFAEGRQSINMIAKRSTQLLKGARQIRKLDFKGAAKTFGIKIPKGASRKKQFADNWLEYHFGWSPLVKTIGEAVDVLQSPIRPIRVSAFARHTGRERTPNTTVDWPQPYWAYGREYTGQCAVSAKIVRVNPNLLLANQLGFTDPLTVAWELVPFSFVVDWFVNVSDFLSQVSSTVGITLSGGCHSVKFTAYGWDTWFRWSEAGKSSYTTVGKGFHFERYLGVPSVGLALKPFNGFSPTRGLTAISLLIQQLRS